MEIKDNQIENSQNCTEPQIRVLEGMDAYLPYVDGVVMCMHNYSLNSYQKTDLTVVVPRHKKKVELPYKVVRCGSIKIPFFKFYYPAPALDGKFKKRIKQEEFDIIHTHSHYNMGRFCLRVAKKKNIPIVGTFHTNFRQIYRNIFKSKWIAEAYVRTIGRFYNKYDELFVCSDAVAEQARSFGYKGKITLLPFGTELQKPDDCSALKIAGDKYLGTNENELVFLFVGRLFKLKRVDFILDSLKILKDKGIKFKFVVIGRGNDAAFFKRHAAKLGFTDKEVVFTGFVDRETMPQLYARADLLLFPSLYDNFALVKVEAAAFSTPGVFIKDSCTASGVEDNVSGFLSDDNVESYAAKIEQAVLNPDLLKQVGHNASEMLYISWEQCTDLLIKRYKEIVKEKKAQANSFALSKTVRTSK